MTGWQRYSALATLLGVAGFGAAVAHRPAPRPLPPPGDGSAWLECAGPGLVADVNGPSGRAAGVVGLPGAAGHRIAAARGPHGVYVTDADTGVVYRVDPALGAVGAARRFAGPPRIVVAGPALYEVSEGAAEVAELDPVSLATRRVLAADATPVGGLAGTGDGSLWFAEPAMGLLRRVRDGAFAGTATIGAPGDSVALAVDGDGVVAVDLRDGRVSAVSAAGAVTPWPGVPAGDGLLAARATDAGRLAVADPATGQVSVTRAGGPAITVEVPRGVGRPLVAADTLYAPVGGELRRFTSDGAALPTVTVAVGATGLQLSASDGLVWANDPGGPDAVVLDGAAVRPVVKYGSSEPAEAPVAETRPVGAPPGPSPGGRPRATGPVLTEPATLRVTAITAFRQTQGRPEWEPGLRSALLDATWQFEPGGRVTFRAPGNALTPATGTYTVTGRTVRYRVSGTQRIGDSVTTLAVAGTVTLGSAPVMSLVYDLEADDRATVYGRTLHNHASSAYAADVRLT